ncbi:MAG: Crp/Fnr family transcriptional regulator [Methylococcales bacterium]
MQQEVFQGLKKIPFFAPLTDDVLNSLVAKAKSSKFPKNGTIIAEGDDTSSLYIILSGKVRVFTSDDKSKEVTLLIQEPGSYFGELALLTDEPRSASVVALEKTVCAVIAKADFLNWLKLNPDVSIDLLGVLSEKIRHLTDKVKQLALSNVYERVISTLKELAHEENGMQIIHNRPTQQDLASMVGSSREMVNKVMIELTKGGYVVVEEKTLRIMKKLPSSW